MSTVASYISKWFEEDPDWRLRHQERVFERYATPDEVAAATSPEAIAALVDVCDQRESAFHKDQRTRERDRAARASAYSALHKGGFPVRLIEAAVGELVKPPGTADHDCKHDVAPPSATTETAAMQHARAYLDAGDKAALVLLGGVGAGKTFAATWVAYKLGQESRHVGYVPSTRLESDGRYDRDRRGWIDGRTLLVIDDVGVEPIDSKGYYVALLEEVIDSFYGSRRRLIITSNLAATTFSERYGARIWSRLCEVGMIASCGAEDLRRKAGR